MSFLKHFFTLSTSTADKKTKIVYVVFRAIAVFMLINQLIMQRYNNALILILTLILFLIPCAIERVLKIEIPNVLEIIIISFIFSSTILGELSDFYGAFTIWDTALHTLTGFLAAGIGFSLVYLLNKNAKGVNLSPLFLALVSFCFSTTIGVMWEFGELSADNLLKIDMQKDRVVHQINSVAIGPGRNDVYRIPNIEETTIKNRDDDGETQETVINGYLDIGLIDTMKDLFVNLIGAIVFSIFGYLYALHDDQKYTFVEHFIPTKSKL